MNGALSDLSSNTASASILPPLAPTRGSRATQQHPRTPHPSTPQNYPGAVTVSVQYELTEANELRVTMRGSADKPTPINLAQHTYWNLGGHGSGTILDHQLTIQGWVRLGLMGGKAWIHGSARGEGGWHLCFARQSCG